MRKDKQTPISDRIREDSRYYYSLCRDGKQLRIAAAAGDDQLLKFARDVRTRKVAANRINVSEIRTSMVSRWLMLGAHIRTCKQCKVRKTD